MFVEALAALDEDPSSLLILHTGAQAHSLESAHVRFHVAVRAVAVHLFGHAAAALARCMRTADAYLQAQWLQLQVKSSDAICMGADMELTRDDLKQVGGARLCMYGLLEHLHGWGYQTKGAYVVRACGTQETAQRAGACVWRLQHQMHTVTL